MVKLLPMQIAACTCMLPFSKGATKNAADFLAVCFFLALSSYHVTGNISKKLAGHCGMALRLYVTNVNLRDSMQYRYTVWLVSACSPHHYVDMWYLCRPRRRSIATMTIGSQCSRYLTNHTTLIAILCTALF